jgi:hypothetical protein
MSDQYDPEGSYDLMYEGRKVGEARKGLYYEGTWEVGAIEGDVFIYNGKPAGSVEGLSVSRHDQPNGPTLFQLVPQKTA